MDAEITSQEKMAQLIEEQGRLKGLMQGLVLQLNRLTVEFRNLNHEFDNLLTKVLETSENKS